MSLSEIKTRYGRQIRKPDYYKPEVVEMIDDDDDDQSNSDSEDDSYEGSTIYSSSSSESDADENGNLKDFITDDDTE